LALSKEYDAKGICKSSKKYQDLKLEELLLEKDILTAAVFEKKKNSITEKNLSLCGFSQCFVS
jgi:hypothetical protein